MTRMWMTTSVAVALLGSMACDPAEPPPAGPTAAECDAFDPEPTDVWTGPTNPLQADCEAAGCTALSGSDVWLDLDGLTEDGGYCFTVAWGGYLDCAAATADGYGHNPDWPDLTFASEPGSGACTMFWGDQVPEGWLPCPDPAMMDASQDCTT